MAKQIKYGRYLHGGDYNPEQSERLCIHAGRCITRTIYKILQLFFDKMI